MRRQMLDAIRDGSTWDLVVVGGGSTGLGTALDAASRGYKTLLLEARDFAQGTSSRSTKLVHGGVRYLAGGQVGLVREALRERGRLRENAPHLVFASPFLVPTYSRFDLLQYGTGLTLYDLLAGSRSFGRSRWVGASEAKERVPSLRTEGLRGGILYYDGQFDDARLAIALMRSVLDQGGIALNWAPVTKIVHEHGRVAGVEARDEETGEVLRIAARVVVNAGGVFADTIRHLDQPDARPMIRASRGSHLVLDRSVLPGTTAVMVPKTDDGRVLFLIPWLDRVILGTTDTPVEGLPIEPKPSAEEVAYMLDHAGRYLAKPPEREEVRSVFAGLRPLIDHAGVKSTAKLSREHSVLVSDSGLVTITGGKWTTYRVMASNAVDRAAKVGKLPDRPCKTASLRLRGATDAPAEDSLGEYGSDAPDLRALLRSKPGWDEPLHPSLSTRLGEVAWAARFEMARKVEDVLARRSRCLLLDARASLDAAPKVAAVLAEELGHDETWQADQVRAFRSLAEGYLLP